MGSAKRGVVRTGVGKDWKIISADLIQMSIEIRVMFSDFQCPPRDSGEIGSAAVGLRLREFAWTSGLCRKGEL